MRYAKFLRPGGKIGFIAPSFGCTTEPYYSRFQLAQKILTEQGYRLVFGPNCYEDKGLGKSNTPEACGAEVNDYLMNEHCDVVISCGGGETMCEDLNYIDFQGIAKAEPKWYMGYSDNTNLTYTLPVLCDTAAIYGPCISNFGAREWHKSQYDAMNIITGKSLYVSNYEGWELEEKEGEEDYFAPYNITKPFDMKISGTKEKCFSFSGRLIGGCLDILTCLAGTPYDQTAKFNERYAEDGIIWFFEACDLNPMGVRRALWQLDNNGWFKYVKAFMIGRPLHYEEEMLGMTQYEAVNGILDKYSVPILFDLDIGHLPPMMPIISGAIGHVKIVDNQFGMTMELK